MNHGSKHYAAKLNEQDVKTIKRRLAAGESSAKIAADYGVVASTIRAIRNGYNWYRVTAA